MSKGANDGGPKSDRPIMEEAAPPPLSEELIAKLQSAVRAAQLKRVPDPKNKSAIESPEKQS
jgi:hypothetical protein